MFDARRYGDMLIEWENRVNSSAYTIPISYPYDSLASAHAVASNWMVKAVYPLDGPHDVKFFAVRADLTPSSKGRERGGGRDSAAKSGGRCQEGSNPEGDAIRHQTSPPPTSPKPPPPPRVCFICDVAGHSQELPKEDHHYRSLSVPHNR
jgi:hypothetical protein